MINLKLFFGGGGEGLGGKRSVLWEMLKWRILYIRGKELGSILLRHRIKKYPDLI